MPTSKVNTRATMLLERLSLKGRKSALDYIEFLAEREEVILPEKEEALREDLKRAKAARASGYRHTLSRSEFLHRLGSQ